MEQSNVVKIRPAELELAVPAFQPVVRTSAANKFIQKVDAQSATESRMVFNWRSPSAGLLCSPIAEVTFHIDIECPFKLSKRTQIGPLFGASDQSFGKHAAHVERNAVANNAASIVKPGVATRALFSFGEGNCVMSACESKTITINGATWTELNSNLYQRSLDECYVPPTEQQRNWSTCGGQQNMDDSVPLSGHVLGLPDGLRIGIAAGNYANQGFTAARGSLVGYECHADGDRSAIASKGFTQTEGATMDSGLCTRMHNFYDQIVSATDAAVVVGVADRTRIYTIEVKAPISGSVFNDLWGANGLSRSDPRNRLALGLPHINSGQIVLQFKELFKRLIRRYGRPSVVGADNLKATGACKITGDDVQIRLNTKYTPNLRLTYIRLPAWRTMPQSVALNVTRREIRRAQGTRSAGDFGEKQFGGGLFGLDKQPQFGLRCASDVQEYPSLLSIQPLSRNVKDGTKDVNWNGVMFPQPPAYIFICYEKDPEFMNYTNPIQKGLRSVGLANAGHAETVSVALGQVAERADPADANAWQAVMDQVEAVNNINTISTQFLMNRYISQNQDSNAAILQLEIVIQSAIGSFAFKDTNSTGNNTYLTDRDILWRTHTRNCHSEYAKKGRSSWQRRKSCLLLSSSDYLLGLSTSPGTVYPITMDVRVKFANLASYKGGLCYTLGQNKGQAEFEDFMVGEPILVGLFTQNVLSLAASSAVYSSQAFSQATTAAALAS